MLEIIKRQPVWFWVVVCLIADVGVNLATYWVLEAFRVWSSN